MNKGCRTCMFKHTVHVQSLDMCIYVPRSHFHFLKECMEKANLRLHNLKAVTLLLKYLQLFLKSD